MNAPSAPTLSAAATARSPAAGAASDDGGPPRPPERVLFVDHTALMGGGEIALLNLVQHLPPDRYTPVVLLFAEGPLAGHLRHAGVETHVLPLAASVGGASKDALGLRTLTRGRDVGRVVAHVWQVARIIRRLRVRVVHTNSLKADVIGGLAGRLARRPVVWHVRDRVADDYLPPAAVRVFRALCRVVPQYVIANSASTLQTVVDGRRTRAVAVPSGIDLRARRDVVHDGTRATDDEGDGPAGDGVRRVGLIGRISPWKGQDVFLRAAAVVRRRFPDVRFQIIGAALFAEEAYEHEVRRLATELKLDDRVEFLGFRQDVSDLIGRLEVLVHASTLGEPFGQVIIEGMAAGKPVVATNGGGVPEIVADGITGHLVPMGDAAAMAEAVCRVLADPAAGRRMGAAGRRRVRDHFTIEQTAAKVAAVYDRILGRPPPGQPPLGRGRSPR